MRGLRHWCQVQAVAESSQDEWDWRAAHWHPVSGRRGQRQMESGKRNHKIRLKKNTDDTGLTINMIFVADKEDRWRRLWGDLRGSGSVEPGHCCLKGGVCSTTQTGAEDGGGCAEETSGWVMLSICQWWSGISPHDRAFCQFNKYTIRA